MATEKRLIEVSDENIKAVLEKVPYYPDEIWKFTAMTERFPTVDAVEVVHGHWERFKHPSGTHGIRCSRCKVVNGRKSSFCPHCGAHMEEEEVTG